MSVMVVDRIAVAPGVELAADRWPACGSPDVRASAVPFLLVHGLASNARMWDGVAGWLTDAGHEVVTVDLRGHGRSSKPDDGYAVAQVADDLAALVSGMRLDRPVVAGQSWGGNVVLELAARHPASVRGIALVDGGWIDLQSTFPAWPACREALKPPPLVGRPLAEIEGYLRQAHADWPETGIQGALANFEVRPDGTIAPWLTLDRHLLVLRGLWEHRPARRYPDVAAPALLIPADTAESARMTGKRAAVEAAGGAIRRSEIRWLVGDHDLHAQQPAIVGALLHDAAAGWSA
jgi:pimeloyl-ACP methyl ester carboxylesterase